LMLESTDTSILGGLSDDLEITSISPASSPRVLKEPVVNTTFSSITNQKDTMVEISTAVSTLDDST